MPHEMTDPIPLDYAEPERRSLAARLVRAARRCLIAYFIVSLVTLPFVDAWWIGELPVLALVQVPKTALAGWLRADLVVPLIRLVGLSAGSFSPDYLLARPYALALAYGLVVGPASAPWRAGGRRAGGRRAAWVLAAVAGADFVATLSLAGGPGLTLY